MREIVAALLGATALSVACASVALAADMPTKAPKDTKSPTAAYDWTGFYVGGSFGYLWGHTRVEEDDILTEPRANTYGVIGGPMVGYNWQSGLLVVGLEGDFGWTQARGVGTSPLPPPPPPPPQPPPPSPPLTITTKAPNNYTVNWATHVRGRVGYAIDNKLFYVAGGLGVADLDFREGATTTTVVPTSGGKYYGWSIGGGVEIAVTRNIVGRIEYLYDDFGHKDYAGVNGDLYRVSLTSQTLRGALAWKFDPNGR